MIRRRVERSVAASAPRIAERAAAGSQERPRIRAWVQGQLQHSRRGVVACFAVGERRAEVVQACSSGTDDELPDAPLEVRDSGGGLKREALVHVVMPGDHDIGAVVVERLPQGLRLFLTAVVAARAEAGMVE